MATIDLIRMQTLDLDQPDIREMLSGVFKGDVLDTLSLDWSQKQTNINNIAIGTNALEIQVALNVIDIGDNATNISTNTGNITTNATNISTNTGNITTNATNISTNAGNITTNTTNIGTNTTAIGLASGQLVGNLDFATALIGGVVLLAVNVSDAVQSGVVVTQPSLSPALAVYNQADTQLMTNLVNELKNDLNQAIIDFNAVTAQLNALLLANQNANQMAL